VSTLTSAKRKPSRSLERGADLLLVDERRGRRIAAAAGLAVMGLLGVVAKAKQAGLITAAKPVIDDLIASGSPPTCIEKSSPDW